MSWMRNLADKNIGLWLPAYIKWRLSRRRSKPEHVLFCLVDHFEPIDGRWSTRQSDDIMNRWVSLYPNMASRHSDSDGIVPQHSWFYPGEAYRPQYLEELGGLSRDRFGEVELHLHHANDTEASLQTKLQEMTQKFAGHGLLTAAGKTRFAFIRGNMGLCNSRGPEYCGVNDELAVLRDAGCYADFSMPTAPCASQTHKINSIYYASSNAMTAKGHDTGRNLEAGGHESGHLVLIQGPLLLNWESRKFGMIPRIESGEVSSTSVPTRRRVGAWINSAIHVTHRPEWVFVKVHCHGAQPWDEDVMLGDGAHRLYGDLEESCAKTLGAALHYVTSREMFNIAKAAEAGLTGNPHQYRDYVIPPYEASQRKTEEEAVERIDR